MDLNLLYELGDQRSQEWEDTASEPGPGCGVVFHPITCLCDVEIAPRDGEPPIVVPYVRTDALRRLWDNHNRSSRLMWFAMVAVVTDLASIVAHHAEDVSVLRQACAMPQHVSSGRKSAVTAALKTLFDNGLNLEQAILLSGMEPHELLGILSWKYLSNPSDCERLMLADRMMRERVCPSYHWVARQVGLDQDMVTKYGQRWGLRVAGAVEGSTPLQVRQRIEQLATLHPDLGTGAIHSKISLEFDAHELPKYHTTAKIISRLRKRASVAA